MSTAGHELRERIEAVANASGTGETLLTVAVPPEKPVGEMLERVEEAHAEAAYIRSDGVSRERRAVLERARELLHGYDETPPDGLVLHVGAVAADAEEDVTAYVFDDLPGPVPESVYEWSNEFDVEALERAVETPSTYGLLVVERGGAALGELEGDRVEVLETLESDVMGKTKAGGQSADRFERRRERQKEEFFGTVADEAERAFLADGDATVEGLLVGGTTVTVDAFLDGSHLDHRLRDRVVGGTFAVEYASGQGLRQLAEKGREAAPDEDREATRAALERFRTGLREESNEVAYGTDAVEEALAHGAVETLLVSGGLPVEDVREYEEQTAEEGGEVVVVPPDTEHGTRFDEAFGIAALLRFPLE